MEKYIAHVNSSEPIEINKALATDLDLIPQKDGSYHLLYNKTSYHIQLLEHFQNQKKLELLVNGRPFTVQLEDEYDQLVKKLGLEVVSSVKVNEIHAPMPGLVLEIMVESGQEVQKGEALLILEAMKMENVIKAAGDGVVAEICCQQGQAVEKNSLLIRLD